MRTNWTNNMAELLLNYRRDELGCWLYDRQARRVTWAHRASYEFHVAEIPERHEIDHVCETTICINPAHLEPVTRTEHVARTMRRLGKDDLQLRAAYLRQVGLTYQEIAEVVGLRGRRASAEAVNAAIRKGLVRADEIPRRHSLSEAEREEIFELYEFGVPQPVLAEVYDVDDSHISRICTEQRRRAESIA